MPAALTLILICPSPGSRSGIPAHFNTSGGPYPVITTALGIAVPSFLVAASVWPRTATSACSLCALSCSIDRALRRGRRFPAPLAGQISEACWQRADGRAGAAQQGQRAQGGELASAGRNVDRGMPDRQPRAVFASFTVDTLFLSTTSDPWTGPRRSARAARRSCAEPHAGP